MTPSQRAEESDDMAARLDAMQPAQCGDEAARYAAKEAARRLLARLETPYEQAFTLAVSTPMLVAALETCRDLGIWARWADMAKAEGSEDAPRSLDDVLAMCRVPAEANLVRRLLKHIATYRILREAGGAAGDAWAPTPLSLALGDAASHLDLMVRAGADQIWAPALHLPAFLARHGYAEPRDARRADNWAEVYGCDFFESHRREPARGTDFAALMTATRNYKTDWTAVYDTARLVEGGGAGGGDGDDDDDNGGGENGDGKKEEEEQEHGGPVLFVDVGACHGLDAARLLSRHPTLAPGSLVIQDLPNVLARETETLDPRIRPMAHDFFTPQPVRHARAYFFHAVLHDWSDAECLQILAHTMAVMKRGHSRLLVYEVVVPAAGAAPFQTALDLALMTTLAGRERTEAQWRRLLGDAGLRVLAVHRLPRAVESVIETELA